MTLASGWATATRSYDEQGFPVSTSTSAPEAPPVAGQQHNSQVSSSRTGASNGGGSVSASMVGLWLPLAAPLLMFLAGVVVI
jgi:hypothetical protein